MKIEKAIEALPRKERFVVALSVNIYLMLQKEFQFPILQREVVDRR